MKRTDAIRTRPGSALSALIALAAALALAAPAAAVTNGAPDPGHSYTGLFFGDFFPQSPGLEPGCQGTLVAPAVFMTAAHCLAGRTNRLSTPLYVTFEPRWSGDSAGASRVTRVAWDPQFGRDLGQPHEIAVMLLEEPAPVAPAQLPSEGALDGRDLRGTTFDLVSYGGDPTTGRPGGERWAAVAGFQALTASTLILSGQDELGFGGGCGDSGASVLPRGTDVVVGIWFYRDGRCEAHNRAYRTDTPQAREFLGDFMPLP